MAKKLSRKQRAKLVKRGMELAWDSLQSHLHYLDEPDAPFHAKCVDEYLELMGILRKLY